MICSLDEGSGLDLTDGALQGWYRCAKTRITRPRCHTCSHVGRAGRQKDDQGKSQRMDRWRGSHSVQKSLGLLRADATCKKDIRLGLNCVGGESTTAMAGLLGNDAHLVTYGAMTKRPVPIPASLHIFKNLTSHGFWLSRWYKENGQQQIKLVDELTRIMASGKVSSHHVASWEDLFRCVRIVQGTEARDCRNWERSQRRTSFTYY